MLLKTLICIAILWFCGVSGRRVRRHLVFSEGSRLFFSIDVRDNLFNYSDFFANVFGVKMDWNLPSKIGYGTKKRIQRRDLYQGMEHFLRQQNLNETSCIRKFLCEASVILPKSNHFLHQLYEVIFSPKDEDVAQQYKIGDSKNPCMEMTKIVNECPLSLLSILPGSESNFKVLTENV